MTPSPASSRWSTTSVAVLGLLVSLGLELVHYRAYAAPSAESFCSVGAKLDCASVALSRYSIFLGVPLPLWGALGFAAMATAAWLRSRWLLPLAAFATLTSVGLLGVELLAIGALCLLCEAIHVLSVVLLALAWRQRQAAAEAYLDRGSLLLVFGPAIGTLAALLAFQQPYWGDFGWKGDLPLSQGKTAEGYPWIGAEQPSLVVHEFTDYACPHCKAATSYMLRKVAAHPRQLRVVRRQYARMPCPPGAATSCQLARIAYCAQEQGRFWQADRWLFAHASGRHQVDLGAAARDVGLDEQRLRACVVRADTYERADADAKEARKKRVLSTPYYIVGNAALPPDQVIARIEAL